MSINTFTSTTSALLSRAPQLVLLQRMLQRPVAAAATTTYTKRGPLPDEASRIAPNRSTCGAPQMMTLPVGPSTPRRRKDDERSIRFDSQRKLLSVPTPRSEADAASPLGMAVERAPPEETEPGRRDKSSDFRRELEPACASSSMDTRSARSIRGGRRSSTSDWRVSPGAQEGV
jgi:hypothetical protein